MYRTIITKQQNELAKSLSAYSEKDGVHTTAYSIFIFHA